MTLKLLIADDEQRICSLIRRLIHWDTLPLEFIGFAYDGNAAFERIQQEKPDIVITDIRMPGMTGLELIRACKDADLRCRFVIVSGFAQFDYAYSAIKYGVEDFLLKPIGEQEINDTLARICRDILEQDSLPAAGTSAPAQDNAIQLNRSFLVAMVKGELRPEDYTADHLQRYFGLAFPADGLLVGRILLDRKDTSGSYLYHLQESFSRKLHGMLGAASHFIIDLPQDTQILFLVHYDRAAQSHILHQLQLALHDMLYLVQPYPFMHLTIAIHSDLPSLSAIEEGFALTERLLASRYLLGNNRILDQNMVEQPLRTLPPYPGDMKNRLVDGIRVLESGEDVAGIQQLFVDTMPDTQGAPYLYWDHILRFSEDLLGALDTVIPMGETLAEEQARLRDTLASCCEKEELLTAMLAYVTALTQRLKKSYDTNDSKVIQAIKAYVQAHFHEHLELEDVAGHVYLNPTYLGTFFKRETGMNFSEYLLSVRLDEAKRLLEDVRYNVGEIAGRVGYKDANYFSKIFQKNVGIKPMEYRKLRHKQRLSP